MTLTRDSIVEKVADCIMSGVVEYITPHGAVVFNACEGDVPAVSSAMEVRRFMNKVYGTMEEIYAE